MSGFFVGVSENKNFGMQEEAAGWLKAFISPAEQDRSNRSGHYKKDPARKPDRWIRMYLTQIQFVIFVIGQTGIMHLGCQLDAQVAIMPGFIVVTGDRFLAFRITQNPAEAVCVLLHPLERFGVSELGQLRARGGHIDGQACLMLGETRPG